jgi:phosphate transport system substrate-binding protein
LTGEGYIVSNPSTIEYQKKFGENTLAAATLIIGGSTSVGPVMELLAYAFMGIETDVAVTMQNVTGSSAGVSGATDGTLHIGMVSRALKDAEKTTFNNGVTLCLDGIAVIVHKNNDKVDDITIAQLKEIYTGATTSFEKLS